MLISPGAYHPYAACLLFRGCRDGAVVTANLDGVRAYGAQHDSGFDKAADRIAALEAELAIVTKDRDSLLETFGTTPKAAAARLNAMRFPAETGAKP
jgi:hypothetical protein